MIESLYFQEPLYLISALIAVSGIYIFLKASGREGRIIGLTRTVFFVLLALGLAGPFIEDTRMMETQQKLNVLEDESRSTEMMQNTSLNLRQVNLNRKTILRGNNSNLASAMESQLRSGEEYLLISDGRTDEEMTEVLQKYNQSNSTISVLKPDTKEENAVYISGPSQTVPGAKTRFTVDIRSTGQEKIPLKVELDNETILDKKIKGEWTFNRSFENRGTHRIEASIRSDDVHAENNRYYKVFEVNQKPEILYIGEESELSSKLSEFYDITVKESLPEDLSDYYSVITSKQLDQERIEDYIAEGNGYIYLGNYEKANRYLPLKASDEDYEDRSTRVVMAMESSQYDDSPTLRDSKEAAIGIAQSLRANTKFAGIYYGQETYPFIQGQKDLRTLYGNKEQIMNNIKSFQRIPEKRHEKALKQADKLIGDEGNVILITNGDLFEGASGGAGQFGGKSAVETRRDAITAAGELDPDVDLYVIGTGEITEEREDFMRELIDEAPGARSRYYTSDKLKRLAELELGAGGGTSAFKPIAVIDEDHFITRGVGLSTEISEFNEVKPKSSADVLVSGPGKREFLTSWNYGLGRVAAFSGGQPYLERTLNTDPGLISRSASWTVGNPDRKEEEWIEISETEAPNDPEVTASYQIEGLTYSSSNRYKGEISPESRGFHKFSGKEYGYNYNSEIEKVGYRDGVLDKITSETGGKVYTPSELQNADIGGTEMEEVSHNRPLKSYVLALAVIVLLSEIGYRKLNGKK